MGEPIYFGDVPVGSGFILLPPYIDYRYKKLSEDRVYCFDYDRETVWMDGIWKYIKKKKVCKIITFPERIIFEPIESRFELLDIR